MDAQKKSLVAYERDRPDVVEKRIAFEASQPTLNAKRLVFVDESGYRLGSPPRYGWAPRGEKSPGNHIQGSWNTITMIGAMALDGFRGFMTIDSGTTSEVFLAFIEQSLGDKLREGDLVVMDNLAAHKSAVVVAAIRRRGAEVIFTPPYSPEFNPIEKAWAKLKDIIRKLETRTRDAFDDAVAQAIEAISLDDITAWARHCGYSVSSM